MPTPTSFSTLLQEAKITSRFSHFPGEEPRDQFSIFQPILRGKTPVILTWNIGEVWRFEPIFNELTALEAPLLIIVGYGNFTAEDTYQRVLAWKKRFPQFHYRLARNMHTKAWIGPEEAWIGSANFVPNMVTNLMVRVPKATRLALLPLCQEGENLSKATNPKLITTKRKTPAISTASILLA